MTFSLFYCLRVGYCIHLDALLFTPCLDLLGEAEHNLEKDIQQFHNGTPKVLLSDAL